MKKRNVKTLKLSKKSVSKLTDTNVKGGAIYTKPLCQTLDIQCGSFIDACPTAWICPTENPWECPLPY